MTKIKVDHLTRDKHLEIARLLKQAQDNLDAAANLVRRAPYTDQTLRVQRVLQETLIDTLIAAWNKTTKDDRDGPYPNIGYAVSWPRRRP